MARLIWSPRAADDLEDLVEFIAKDSDTYARSFARRILAAAKAIPRHPLIGRIVPEMENPKIRERIVGNYRLVYRVTADTLEIVTILHGARRLPTDI